PFLQTAGLILEADIAMANLEAPLTDRGEKHPDKQYTFRVAPAAAAALHRAGFDLMTLANNHIGDYGEQGIIDTLAALRQNGIGVSGAGYNLRQARTPHIVKIDGRS
ncbi:MAG: CapA family protein, partial [Desulfuromonadales bacterium]|nr:CapA family protein [Desulfuromonadales bacterium]NIS40359.1 CapA family protein [Desulfuromonadales bacterium]